VDLFLELYAGNSTAVFPVVFEPMTDVPGKVFLRTGLQNPYSAGIFWPARYRCAAGFNESGLCRRCAGILEDSCVTV
jgi:hypothetical protein